jgi:signal transduction histidine kinase/PAS domain-containing protein
MQLNGGAPLRLRGWLRAPLSTFRSLLDRARRRLARGLGAPPADPTGAPSDLAGQLLAHIGDAVIALDHDARVSYWSPAAERMFGRTASQALGRPIADLPECGWIFAGPADWRGMHRHHRPDGVELEAQVGPLADARGAPAGRVAVIRNTTGHRVTPIEPFIQSLPIAVLVAHDSQCARVTGNPAAAALLRAPLDEQGSSSSELARHYRMRRAGRELAVEERPVQYAAAHGVTVRDAELELVFADGEVRYVSGTAAPLLDAQGRPSGAIAAYIDLTESRRGEFAQRLLAGMSRELVVSLDYREMLDRVARLTVPELADYCFIDVVTDEGPIVRAAIAHSNPAKLPLLEQLRRYPPDVRIDAGVPQVIRTGEPLLYSEITPEALAELAHNEEHLRLLLELGPRSSMIVPLIARGATIGSMLVSRSESGRRYTPRDLDLAGEIAARAALAIDNARLYVAAQRAQQAAEATALRDSFMAEASMALAGSLDYQQTLRDLAKLAVPRFADLCVVFLLGDDGMIRRTAVAHVNRFKEEQLRALQEIAIDPAGPHPAAEVMRAAATLLNPDMPSELLEQVTPAEQIRSAQTLVPESQVIVPLVVRQRIIGALAFGTSESQRRYGARDVALAEELARRAALAIDNARLYGEAQEAVRVRDAFLSIAAHELKNPLTIVRGHLQLLRRRTARAAAADPRDTDTLDTLLNQTDRLQQLIDVLLDISRLERGQLDIVRQPIDLGQLMRSVIESIQPGLQRHTLEARIPDQPLAMQGDPLRLEQVFHNLLQNAVKYSPAGGPISLELRAEGAAALVTVRDWGIGIPQEAQPQLFRRFFRAGNTAHAQGIGVGLYIVREIVMLHGGTITFESAEGEGSTFMVRLPLVAPGGTADDAARQ